MGKITDEPDNPDDQRKEGILFFPGNQKPSELPLLLISLQKETFPFPAKGKRRHVEKISVPAISG